MTSLLAQSLLFTAGTDLGYYIYMYIDANEKFISVSVRAFRTSDAPGQHICKSGCRPESCRATASVVLRCSR